MYEIVTVKTKVSIPPERFGMETENAIKESVADQYEGKFHNRLGVGLVVSEILETGEGKILPGDPSIHVPVTFNLLVYKPELHEIVVGEVIDNTEFGSFIRFGPVDGLVHVSQLLNDYVSYDDKNSIFSGKESKRTLKEGDSVRSRIISVNLNSGKENKIGLTMRQYGLGAFHWIEDEKKKAKKTATKKSG